MSPYVASTEQLVTEILVRDIRRSVDFYRSLGFELLRDAGDFVELTWEEHRLFLAERSAFHGVEGIESPVPPPFPLANVRVMVPDVDEHWARVRKIGADVVVPIADRYYGYAISRSATPTASVSASRASSQIAAPSGRGGARSGSAPTQ